MDFYVIPPTADLELMNQGDRFFCLAQLYMKPENNAYREFFKHKKMQGKWVTLDNGAGDFDIVTAEDLFEIMIDLCPSEVIPPDILFDGLRTIRNLETFTRSMYDVDLLKTIQTLGCPQGATKEEWLFVYKYMLAHPYVSTIGLSKIAVPKAFLDATNDKSIMESRHMCYDLLKSQGLIQKPIHFLGAGDMNEFAYYKNDPLMRSTDSCNTIWSGMNQIAFKENNFKRIPTPHDYFDRSISPLQQTIAEENIEWFRDQLHS
jgi:hypothetical protein